MSGKIEGDNDDFVPGSWIFGALSFMFGPPPESLPTAPSEKLPTSKPKRTGTKRGSQKIAQK